MAIDLMQATSQAMRLRNQAAELCTARASLTSYQRNLNSTWTGSEVDPVNDAISDHVRRLETLAVDLEAISRDVVREAEAIRAEEMAANIV